jgi:hypothetical protein
LITAAWASDRRLAVTVELADQPAETARTLRIEVPDAQAWFIENETVKHISGGTLITQEDDEVLRNDRAKLQAIAAQARAWYQRTRSGARVSYGELVYDDFQIGWLVTDIFEEDRTEQINTIITRLAWDFSSATTIVQTDHAELDYQAVALTKPSPRHGDALAGILQTPEPGPAGDMTVGHYARLAAAAPTVASGVYNNPADLLPADEDIEQEAQVDYDPWDRASPPADTQGVDVKICTRVAYDHTASTPRLYAFYREFSFDSQGMLKTIGAETRYTVDEPTACTY